MGDYDEDMDDQFNEINNNNNNNAIDGRDYTVLIPIQGSDEKIALTLAELPEDAEDMLDILRAEVAPLDIWLKVAVVYCKVGKINQFLHILEQGTDPQIEDFYPNSKSERVAFFNALASYYTQLGAKERDKKKRGEYFDKATGYFYKSDKIDPHDPLSWVGKALLMIYQGSSKWDQALTSLEGVLESEPNYVPALLGKACILYNKERYKEALGLYAKALEINPMCQGEVRLGIGYCFVKLGKPELAHKAFERVLQFDNNNLDALLALAILEQNLGKQSESTLRLKRGYEISPHHPVVLNLLSAYYLRRDDYDRAEALSAFAQSQSQLLDVTPIKAESCFHVARHAHATGRYENAYKYYFQATKMQPDHVLAQYGLGQMHIQRGEYDKAIQVFEHINKLYPEDQSTLKVMGSLYALRDSPQDKEKEKAKVILRKLVDEYDSVMELAQLTEKSDPKGAMHLYERAIEIVKKRGDEDIKLPSELYNNLGVLTHVNGKLEEAEQFYLKSISENKFPIGDYKAVNVTATYNLARLYEDMAQYQKAEELFKGILKHHPNYIDGYLRMGCMARDKGLDETATEWYKDAFTVQTDNVAAWTLIGSMHLNKSEWQPAQKKFERVLEVADKNDAYSLLALGNIYYNAKFSNPEKEEKYLKLARDFFMRVLERFPTNIYAANGLAIIFGERGNLKESREFFNQVREATPLGTQHMIDVMINLAHIYFAQGSFANAVNLYQNCLKSLISPQYSHTSTTHIQSSVKDPTNVLLYLAKAYFEWGKFEQCKDALQRAIHLSPSNHQLWFNLGLSQGELGIQYMKKEARVRTPQDLDLAIEHLTMAKTTFTWLISLPKAKHPVFSVTKAQKHAQRFGQALQHATQVKQEEVNRDEARKSNREMQIKIVEEARQKRNMLQEEQQSKEEQRRIELDRMAEEDERRSEELARMLTQGGGQALDLTDESKKKKKGSGKRKKKGNDEEDTQGDPEYENAEEQQGVEEGANGSNETESVGDIRNVSNPKAEKLKKLAEKAKEKTAANKKKRRGVEEGDEDTLESPKRKEKKKKKKSEKSVEEEEENVNVDELFGDENENENANGSGGAQNARDEDNENELKIDEDEAPIPIATNLKGEIVDEIRRVIKEVGKANVSLKHVMRHLRTKFGEDVEKQKNTIREVAYQLL
eukprot:TRINITY_DN2864_c0_g1_i24.p1 TRINITY_DN2864_c0_g1~~TRINITY_DN2864_c0_g1_i24.p1  ORF type:complete len:1165 (-),score=325.28 TRINITY_DN2864_c0_g1_i24:196-3690(-)